MEREDPQAEGVMASRSVNKGIEICKVIQWCKC